MKRYKYLDIARGIGLLLVIISHSCGLSSYLINYYIPLFFVVSGYIYKPGRSYGENIGRKAKRLLIPYFGYSAVLLAFYALMGRSMREMGESVFGVLYSRYCLYDTTTHTDNVYLFTVANGAMWYLTAFFVTSLVYHLVIDRCLASRKFLLGCAAVLIAVTMALAELPVLLPWSLDIACVGALFMIVGTLLGRAEFFERKWNLTLVLGVLAAYLLLSYVNPGINMSIREFGIYGALSVPCFILIGIAGSVLCIWLGKLIERSIVGRAMAYIGQNTIVLLAFHILGLELFEAVAAKFVSIPAPGSTTASGILWFTVYHAVRITASVCGCLVLGKLLDLVRRLLSGKIRTKKTA